MAQFRKRPVVIEAVQYVDTVDSVLELQDVLGMDPVVVDYGTTPPTLKVTTLEGVMRASPGDWIIKGVNGEFYPCKPDIFAKTYEPLCGCCGHELSIHIHDNCGGCDAPGCNCAHLTCGGKARDPRCAPPQPTRST